ncbi:hypothetical protein [Allocoleopsis sp.]|uniref:hypothetical protein n=1 Tax=Allocoleopsis sp. TaxID=3088169 RepID=UPI002FCE7798
MNIHDNTTQSQEGYLALLKCCSPIPRYWLGWTPESPTVLLIQITLVSPYPIELLWSIPGSEDEEEALTYPYISYWIPDSDWFELPPTAVDEICNFKWLE